MTRNDEKPFADGQACTDDLWRSPPQPNQEASAESWDAHFKATARTTVIATPVDISTACAEPSEEPECLCFAVPRSPEEEDPLFGTDRAVAIADRAALRASVGPRPKEDDEADVIGADRNNRDSMLWAMLDRSLLREHVIGTAAMAAAVDALCAGMPNMRKAGALAKRALSLSEHTGRPLRMPPLLLLGPPGAGKTRFAKGLADAIGAPFVEIDGTSTVDQGPFVGYAPGWRRAEAGRPAHALATGTSAGPIVFVDEVDKVGDGHQNVGSLDGLLRLLEPSTSGRFSDAFLGIPMRADGITWIFTANRSEGLSKPLLDRMVKVDIEPLTEAQSLDAIAAIAQEVLAEHGIEGLLSRPGAELLKRDGLRRARQVITMALPTALAAGRRSIDESDIAEVLAELGDQDAGGRPIGFIHHRQS